MTLPSPTYSFTIPSLHDDVVLGCRLYHPELDHYPQRGSRSKYGAVIAHPYAPLGGSADDPVVEAAAAAILDAGFVVGTFNFRGAAGAKGRTTWSGHAELNDYVTFAGFLIHYLDQLEDDDAPTKEPISLIAGGYSYGSLIASHLLSTSEILKYFSNPSDGSAAAEILLRAGNLSSQTNHDLAEVRRDRNKLRPDNVCHYSPHSPVTVGGDEAPRASREVKRSVEIMRSLDIPRRIKSMSRKPCVERPATAPTEEVESEGSPVVKINFFLLSPVLPPVSTVLAPGLSSGSWFGRTSNHTLFKNLCENPTLVVYGDSDGFTSAKKMQTWTRKMMDSAQGKFTACEIPKAGHFWREQGVEEKMTESVRRWIQDVVKKGA